MGTCLVTTLKESVKDNNILKLGEAKFRIENNGVDIPTYLTIKTTKSIELTVSGGYITNSTGTQNLGTSITLMTGDNRLYISSGTVDILISNKYAVSEFGCYSNPNDVTGKKLLIDVGDLLGVPLEAFAANGSYLQGDFDIFGTCHNLWYLWLFGSKNSSSLFGDIDSLLNTRINHIRIYNCKGITGDISSFAEMPNIVTIIAGNTSIGGNLNGIANNNTIISFYAENTNISGDIAVFSTMPQIEGIGVNGTSVTGSINSLSTLTNLQVLNISNTAITGDTSSLVNLTNLTTFYYANSGVTGTWPLT